MILTKESTSNTKFYLPPEFSTHFGTILMFPFRDDIWRCKAVYVQNVIAQIAKIISEHEKVFLCVSEKIDMGVLPTLNSNVKVVRINYDDIWARDISPFFITDGKEIKSLCCQFNAWGGKEEGSYYPWDDDAAFSRRFSEYMNIDYYLENIILEGGAVANNGAKVLITTESVLLNKNRNPSISKNDIERLFKFYFGIEKVIWLKRGFLFDETDGHIDNFLNFVDEHNILLAWTNDKSNPQFDVLNEAFQIIENEKAIDGRDFVIHKILMPEGIRITDDEATGLLQHDDAILRNAGDQLFATYNNAYIFNGGVLMPTFNLKYDKQAIDLYATLFQGRKIYPLYSKELLIGGGNFHCILHEIPII